MYTLHARWHGWPLRASEVRVYASIITIGGDLNIHHLIVKHRCRTLVGQVARVGDSPFPIEIIVTLIVTLLQSWARSSAEQEA